MTTSGREYIWEVLKALGLEYAASNPAASQQECGLLSPSGGNVPIELLECCQEECSVAMAHGYAKIEGKPMAALLDGALGLKHAAMAIYNAYADRVPIYLIAANSASGEAQGSVDVAATVRELTKWDDEPRSLSAFRRSAAQAYKVALTPPMAPVLIVAGPLVQDSPRPDPGPPMLGTPAIHPPEGDREAVRDVAKLLVSAKQPLIIAQRAARTPQGLELLVELAELLGSPVTSWERMNFPGRHPLAGSGGDGYDPDVVLALEVNDVGRLAHRARARHAKFIHISSLNLDSEPNFVTQGPYAGDVDIDMGADAQATLPALIEECRRSMTADGSRAAERRARQVAEAHRNEWRLQQEEASRQWNRSPVSPARLCGELWRLIEHEDWSLVSWEGFLSGWPGHLWNFDKHYRYIGGQGAGGLGYGAAAAAGAALANRKHGRLSINIQSDGDLMYAPGILWTLAHHRIPLLTIMHNNRAYHAEVGAWRAQAIRSNRDPDRARIGTALDDPAIDYASMARSMGLYAEGPIADPRDLRPAFTRGIEKVKRGEPVLIDVLTQPR